MRLQILVAAAVFAASMSIHATTLASATDGTGGGYNAPYQGQSFRVTGSGNFDDITFNFYSAPSTPFAAGTGYLFATPYTGTPAGLNSGDAGLLGTAASSGGVYTFDAGMTLTAGDEYYFYEDASIPNEIVGQSSYSGGSAYSAYYISSYATYSSADFLVTGQPVAASVTPEPSSLVLLGTGLLGIAGAVRRRMWVGEGSQTGC